MVLTHGINLRYEDDQEPQRQNTARQSGAQQIFWQTWYPRDSNIKRITEFRRSQVCDSRPGDSAGQALDSPTWDCQTATGRRPATPNCIGNLEIRGVANLLGARLAVRHERVARTRSEA